jgi:hypothetical protein
MLELFHQRAMAAAAAAATAAAAGRTAATASKDGGGLTVSGSSSRAGKGASLPSHAASFLWALPRLLLGHTGSRQSVAAAAPSRQQQQPQPQPQQQQQQALPRQQQQQQQQQQSRVVSKTWMRQYCWLLQVRGQGGVTAATACTCQNHAVDSPSHITS